MLQPGPASGDRFANQVFHDRAALGPELALVTHFAELVSPRRVANHESAKPSVANEDVGAEPQHEVGYTGFASGKDGIGQRVGRSRVVEQVGGSADSERGVRRDRLMAPEKRAVQAGGETFDRREIGAGHGRE